MGSVVYVGGSWFAMKYMCLPVKSPIKVGLVMSIFWTGAVYAVGVAGLANTIYLFVWNAVSPSCNIGRDMGLSGLSQDTSPACIRTKWVQWILTAGFNEELLKFAALLRLRPSLTKVVNSCCLTRCLRSSTTPGMPCCAWFLKLAASPLAVVLCGMASGAGFATLENVG